ncbi:SWF/SNF helicase family protein [Ectopseudomonas oleovorans]|uniref:SWF/SNF helicase family protein n=1 Tax=Ectopseudomonas oleovorans TaxID=301 RepID=A0AA42TWZ5_ECTOL|nr:C-terminal helicase domain-containing protein [Pseudomonas oleovorans]MDH1337714.1 SWF/SNF helicase family protein [Pseudomonas oleovorans]WGG19664.1 SWF/SNF helicase family protein [Pseudomonas oleovorans]
MAGLQQLNWDSEGVGSKAAALVDLSTVAGNKISNPPWVKFQSAGWVNFPSAPTGDKVILFMMTKRLQRVLKLWLDQIYDLNVAVINGDTQAVATRAEDMTRKKLIAEFEAKSGFNILIMSPVAAGVGLTVIGANHVVHLERHWNPAKEAQASDRVYRIGQTKPVFIHLPAVIHPQFDSFDVHLDRLLRGKLMLKDAVVTPEAVSESEMMQSMGL